MIVNIKIRKIKSIYLLLITSISLLTCCYSCIRTKKTIDNRQIRQVNIDLKPYFEVSAKTRILIKDIEKELTEKKISFKNYVPSKNFIDKYDIKQVKNTYVISGFMITKENFIQSTLDDIYVETGSNSGKFTTVQVPINNFDLFLKNESIEYFQVAEKVKTN